MISRNKIEIISFDLVNTLYDNRPVITYAENQSRQFLAKEFAKQGKEYNHEEFVILRNALLAESPLLFENLSLLRQTILKELCEGLGNCNSIANGAFELFMQARLPKLIPKEIELMLEQLAAKFKLVAVTNGNCDVGKLSMGKYFHNYYSPQQGHRAKPHPQMLKKIISDYSLEPQALLHIGDQLDTDGEAAKNANCPFVYFAPFDDQDIEQHTSGLLSLILGSN